MPAGLTAPTPSSGAVIPLVGGTSNYKIDVDDIGIPGARSFYIIVTADGTSTQTFGPYSLTMSCTMVIGGTASSNVVPTEPAAISASSPQELFIGDPVYFIFSPFSLNYPNCPIIKYELTDSSATTAIVPTGI